MKVKRRPALYLAIAMIIGILSSYILLIYNFNLILKVLLMIEVAYLFYYTIFNLNFTKKSIYIWLTIIFLIIGSFLYSYQEYKYRSSYSISNFAGSASSRLLAEIEFDIGDLESDKVYLNPYSVNGQRVKYGSILL